MVLLKGLNGELKEYFGDDELIQVQDSYTEDKKEDK